MLPSHLRGRRLRPCSPMVWSSAEWRRTGAGHCVGHAIRRNSAGQDQLDWTTSPTGAGEHPGKASAQTGALQLDLVVGKRRGHSHRRSYGWSGRAAARGGPRGRWSPGRAAAIGRRWRPGPQSGGPSAAPGAPPMSGRAWLGEAVAAEGLMGRPGGVDRVGLGAVPSGGPLGPI